MDQTGNIKPGEWRSVVSDSDTGALVGLNRVRGSRYTANVIQIQESLTDYFNSEQGEVPWQWADVRSTQLLHSCICLCYDICLMFSINLLEFVDE